MSNDLDFYLSKIPAYNQKPNFNAFLTMLLKPFIETRELVENLPNLFDLDNAVGAQLDVVGLWVGQSRNLPIALPNVYFSFDIPGLGVDQAVWYRPYDPLSGYTQLDDDHYRLLLRVKIAANHWDGTMQGVYDVFSVLFGSAQEVVQIPDPTPASSFNLQLRDGSAIYLRGGYQVSLRGAGSASALHMRGGTQVQLRGSHDVYLRSYGTTPTSGTVIVVPDTLLFIQDNCDMSIVVAIAGKLPSAVVQALLQAGFIALRALGVKMSRMITSVDETPIFGLDCASPYVSGLDIGALGVE